MSINDATMKLGQEGYALCVACHGVDGKGVENVAPPLAGSEWVLGPAENIIRMQMRGLQGPISVNGKEWDLVMAPLGAAYDDTKLAATLTYVRNSWGNEASEVSAADVAKWRHETGQPMLTVADLIDPNQKVDIIETVEPGSKTITVEPLGAGESNPLATEASGGGLGLLAVLGVAAWAVLCLIPVVKGALTK